MSRRAERRSAVTPAVPVRSPTASGWTLPLQDAVWSHIARDLGLSRRETEIVRHVLDNLEVHDIAERCVISSRTVRAHLERVYRKLGLRNRGDLILVVLATVLERHGTGVDGARDTGAGATGVRTILKESAVPS